VKRHLAARLFKSLVIVIIVSTISFFLIRLAPGDPFSYDSPNFTPAIRAQWRAQFGYDRPLPEQFARYVTSIAHGQFGYSHTARRPVSEALADAIPRTLLLAGVSLAISFAFGIMLGVVQATRPGSWLDRITSSVMMFFYSLPDFWFAIMMLLIFTFWWPVFPPGGVVDPVMHGYMGPWKAFVDRAYHLVLPALTLSLLTAAAVARYQRSAMLDVLPMEFVQLARAKGVSERRIVWRHALRAALTPVIALLGLLMPALVGGSVFVETVFNWNGMGLLTAEAIRVSDYDLVTAAVVVGSVMVALGNLIADLLHAAVDPRFRD
jgi:peptide/nickel transport system permease protein